MADTLEPPRNRSLWAWIVVAAALIVAFMLVYPLFIAEQNVDADYEAVGEVVNDGLVQEQTATRTQPYR